MAVYKKVQYPVKIIFLGSRPASVKALEIIERKIKDHKKNWVDVTVVTSSDEHPPESVVKWWNVGNLGKVASKIGFKTLDSISDLPADHFDLGISFFFTDIIPERMINNSSRGIVNIHFGYLPTNGYSKSKGSPHKKGEPYSRGTYRGSNVLSHAIINNEKWQAVTLHFISKIIDLGPVIEQVWNPITSKTTAWDLQKLSEDKAISLLDKYFSQLVDNPEKIKTLKPELSKYPYYNRSLLQDAKILPHNISKEKLNLFARAMSFPNTEPPYFLDKNSKGEIKKSYVIYKKNEGVIIMEPTQKKFIQKIEDIT